MIGQTLNNRYKISSRLGKGAMGTVYRATDTQTGQEVALKVIAIELAFDPEMLERFKREGEALRQLKHPNIVGFIDAFQHEDTYVIVMEYVSGGSLFDLIKAGRLPIEKTRQITLDICDALIRAHRLNIIHRDLKPENILIDESGTPKLADFGVARLSEGTRMTRSGTQVGTPYYMAPEAWEGKTLDAQADIWSLGVILFEMLTGRVPFDGETGPAVMNKVFTTPPPDLKKLSVDIPTGMAEIVARMLARDMNRRYKTMRQVAVDLESGEISSTKKPAATRSASAPKPGRLLTGIGALLTIVVLGAIAWSSGMFSGNSTAPTITQDAPPKNTQVATIVSPVVVDLPGSTATQPPQEAGPFEGTIKIVSQSPLTGEQSVLGNEIKQGAELAFEQLSGDLIIMGFDIQFIPYDDQADPDTGVVNAKEIIADPDVLCGVGHLNSRVMVASSEKYHTAGLAFVSPANTRPDVTTRGYLEVNRIVGRDDGLAPAVENYAFEILGARTVYIVHDNTDYGMDNAQYFSVAAAEDGMQVLSLDGPDASGNFSAIVDKLQAVNPDVVFFGGLYDQAGVFFRQARDAGYEGPFLGSDGLDATELVDIAGDALATGGGTYYAVIAGPPSYYGADGFIEDYIARFGAEPQPYSLQAYDAMGICLTAIKNAAIAANGIPTRSAIATMIRELTYAGLTGTIQFDEIGDLPEAKYLIVRASALTSDDWYKNEIIAEINLPSPGR